MSQKETPDGIGHLIGRSPKDNLRTLSAEAREAFEQKRTEDCLNLIQAILLIDPDHATAQWMRSSIESEMQRDRENARVNAGKPHSKNTTGNHAESGQSTVRGPALLKNILEWAVRFDWRQTFGTHRLALGSALIALAFIIAGLYFFLFRPSDVAASRLASSMHVSKPVEETNSTKPIPLPRAPESLTSVPAKAAEPGSPAKNQIESRDPVPTVTSPAPRPLKSPNPPDATRANGTLAVSSPASVDIYKDDTYIGSAPVSLDLPPGMQTLEYRHGSLTKKVTLLINSNETTRATITFDVEVQINSMPWAEVFLDGVERKALGQTPLSGVRVPIGSVLVFENPGFPQKKYRITGNETGIQVVFP